MKKIVILSNSILGLNKFRKELINKYKEQGNEIYVISPNDNSTSFQEIEEIVTKVIKIDVDRRGVNPIKDIKLLKEYFTHVKSIRPDYVLTYTIKPNLYGGLVCRVLKIKQIANVTGVGAAFVNGGILEEIVTLMSKVALKKTFKVFFQNKSNFELFLNKKIVTENQSTLINGSGVNLRKFLPETKSLNLNKTVFLFLARVMEAKGINEFLDVAKDLKLEEENLEFQILGPWEESDTKIKVMEYERDGFVKYIGTSDDVRKELREIDVLVNPSYYEGMSNVLLEAGAMKKFLIASNIPGCKEIIINNETGFTFELKDKIGLKNSILKYLKLSSKDKEEMIEKQYKHIRDNFSREKVVEEYLKITI